ncbi:alanine--glyoxylate aminotransferase family protein [candidate division KSB1 bacterium]|nr:alanine--glyoxylate aminotransferase family protein [candidate division KSB1 bacterium]NIR73446.1 alanine--glyoxylate aminotransferase family protein [candidate division KSB1 bacterium]NIS27061.1 alanine--glyoxylate aminotransferase family protein [candidate division KSB1 bacterium]NIT73905.1 alanine--glyoxylate aminotransferase family protein [candidate division KSB1 bacterium]NIU27806.1 alanine--glyoxylate aminotransferase family protein [candidate division KSB1 bacterium]
MRARLFTPGPTQVPERVHVAMSNPIMHHRGSAFKQIYQEVTEDLRYFFQTIGDVLTFTSSGTGALEASVVNLLSKNDPVLTVAGGKFGQRLSQLCQNYGANTHTIEIPWGEAVDPDDIKTFLAKHPKTVAVFLAHSETSTGVAADLQTIAEIVRQNSEALLVVDAITSAGVLPFKMDEWGVDVAITGSQKGLMIPPGLAMVALNARAWERVEHSNMPKFYFDFKKEKAAQEKQTTAWTPAITLFVGLREALNMIREEGLERLWEKYALLAEATREGVRAMGLELFAKSPSDSLTAVKIPDRIDGLKFVQHLREKYGITVAGGQAHLKGKIFRIAHMGYYDSLDMVAMASALEMSLSDFAWEFEPGSGVYTVQTIFMKENASK